jgi:putative two-component system response regulator
MNKIKLRDWNESTEDLECARLELISYLSKALTEYRDTDTGRHVLRVGYYAKELAEAMGLERDFQELLFQSSPLHDLGKIGIPDRILLKAGKLDADEWVIMRAHSNIGAEILDTHNDEPGFLTGCFIGVFKDTWQDDNPFLKMAASIALNHHERWDGSGYPSGLAGNNIPMEGRIVAMADVYDALFSVRPYKRPFTEEHVMEILEQERPKYDPEVFLAFENRKDRFREIRIHFTDSPN